jgi:preprotein translocase subunit YajC
MLITNAYASDDTIAIEGAETLPKAPDQLQSSWTSIVPMVLIFVVLYFFLIRPQEKRRKQQEELVGGVKKGEEVITSSGIMGTVTKVSDNNIVEIEVAKDVQIKMLKSAIVDITSRKPEVKDKKEQGKSAKSA